MYVDESSLVKRAETDKKWTALLLFNPIWRINYAKIFKVSLLAVLSSLAVNSFASTAEVKVLEPQLNYQQLLTQRQVVDELLEQAVKIQNSPARVSNAGFTAKLPSNMERIADLLLEAYKLEPYRVDFLFGAANANIYNGNTDKAIELYQKCLMWRQMM